MKKIIFALAITILSLNYAIAQKPVEMKEVWQVKLSHDFDEAGSSDNILYGSNDKNYSVIKTSDGSTLWSSKFKEIYEKINKIDLQFEVFDANALFMFDKKMGKDQLVVADLTTGKMLWHSEKYQNIEEFHQSRFDYEDKKEGLLSEVCVSDESEVRFSIFPSKEVELPPPTKRVKYPPFSNSTVTQ